MSANRTRRLVVTGVRRAADTGWSLRTVATETFRNFRADRGFDLAGSLAFTTLLTAVPLLATFSLFLVTFFRENDDQILAIVNAVIPYQTSRLTQSLRDFIAESTAISGVGLVLLVIASVRLVFVVEGIFNAVWGAPRRRRPHMRFLVYTLGLLALGVVMGGVGLGLRAMRSADPGSVLHSPAVAAGAPFLLKAFVLTLIYRYLPNARVRLSAAAVSGSAVALGLELLRVGFTFYVEAMLRMNLVTGSLALILIVLVSVYFAWAMILFGVELTHVLQVQSAVARSEGRHEGRTEKAIRMLLCMSSVDAAPLRDLETNPDASTSEMLAILDDLKHAGLVEGSETAGFRLARSGRKITVAQVVDALSPELLHVDADRGDRVALALGPLFSRLDAERRSLLATTISQLRAR